MGGYSGAVPRQISVVGIPEQERRRRAWNDVEGRCVRVCNENLIERPCVIPVTEVGVVGQCVVIGLDVEAADAGHDQVVLPAHRPEGKYGTTPADHDGAGCPGAVGVKLRHNPARTSRYSTN